MSNANEFGFEHEMEWFSVLLWISREFSDWVLGVNVLHWIEKVRKSTRMK